MTPRSLRLGLGLSAVCLAWLGSTRDASATGRYDPKTGMFYLSYTYARLPNDTNEDSVLISQEVPRTSELDAKVAQFYQVVSDDLGKVTGGRGFLAPPDYTTDIRKADVIISPDTPFQIGGQYRGGWGTLNGFSSQTGQLAIYIESLKQGQYSSEGQRLTVVHELCHYLFGLPDEYNSQACPLPGQPRGQGCLMDNYNVRTWPGFLCNDSSDFKHNPAAVTYKDPKIPAEKSCQRVVDDFFSKFGIDENAKFNPPTGGVSVAGATGLVGGGLSASLAKQVQDKARTLILDHKAKGLPADKKSLVRKLTGNIFDLLKESKLASPSNLESVAELALESVGIPPIVPKTLERLAPLFESEAKRLAQALDNKPGRNLSILDGLLKFAANPGAGNSPASVATTDELDYLNNLAKQAAGTTDPQAIDPAKAQVLYLSQIAAKLDAMLVSQNIPGGVESRALIRKLDADLAKIGALPPATRDDPFKKARGTLVIAPPLVEAEFMKMELDQVIVHPGVPKNYNDLRRQCIQQFDDLIDKGRVDPVYGHRFGTDGGRTTLLSAGIRRGVAAGAKDGFEEGIDLDDKEAKAAGLIQSRQVALQRQRSERILGLIDVVYQGIYTDTIKNVAVLIPPNGLPTEISGRLDDLKPLIIGKTDLRLDLVQVGSAPIPRQLRDLSTRSGGSVLTVTDQDEVGAVSQRLAIDQSQGTWVNVPLQGTILFSQPSPNVAAPPVMTGPTEYTLFQRMSGERLLYPVGSVAKDGSIPKGSALEAEARLALRPFYVDAGSSYQFVAGFTTDLNVPVADNPDVYGDAKAPAPESDITPELKLVPKRINEQDPNERAVFEKPNGRPILDFGTPNLKFDSEHSSTNVLVFTMPPASGQGVLEGWYTPVLVLKKANFRKFADAKPVGDVMPKADPNKQGDTNAPPKKNLASPATYHSDEKGINFTFSVGTQHSNAQLVPTLLQDTSKYPYASNRGTLTVDAKEAVIQVQMLVGAPVKNASLRGYYERVEVGKSKIAFVPFGFQDKGLGDDTAADDGIYTGRIPLPTGARRNAEYRVIIVAEHRDRTPSEEGTAFIDLAESIQGTDKAPVDKLKNVRVPRFQRATSLNFRAEGELPDAAFAPSAGAAPGGAAGAFDTLRKSVDALKAAQEKQK